MKFIKPILIFFVVLINAQTGFQILDNKKKIEIPFKQINNLAFIDLKINEVNLTFLLDTGVAETLLFSLENKDISFENVEKVNFTGLGGSTYVEGIKSTKNTLKLNKDFIDKDHTIYIVLDEEFNFSSHVGIPVNGIIGYHFFKNQPIKIDFERHIITVYNEKFFNEKKLKKFEKLPISIEGQKPYLVTEVQQSKDFFPAKMLVDLGNSDALWLFPNRIPHFNYNRPNIDDFLGRGFNGDIYGKRSRIHAVKLGKSTLNEPIASMPSEESVKSMNFAKGRIGSIGSDILKRFTIVFDYPNNNLYIKKSKTVKDPFKFNMSGLDIKHDGMKWESDLVKVDTPKPKESSKNDINVYNAVSDFQYKFILKPEYSVAGVRENSPAYFAEIKKGDKLLEINGKKTSDMTLQHINEIFLSEENRKIKIKLLRNSVTLLKEFVLKDPIPFQEN
ncbi:PDZ domain-containing protein [Cloacibacterium sp.]|uniref:PDZ domain-containing protein n=1 Tax=Cloacibacterium sp. TaxID=1913682 RepID=UPI0035AEB297